MITCLIGIISCGPTIRNKCIQHGVRKVERCTDHSIMSAALDGWSGFVVGSMLEECKMIDKKVCTKHVKICINRFNYKEIPMSKCKK